jgi:branched-chain amino acid transport system permease protein
MLSARARTLSRPLAAVVVIVAAAIVGPGVLDAGWLATCTTAAAFAMVAAAIGILYGKLGLTSLAQVTFAGVGAWTAMRLHFATGLPFVVLVPTAGLITAAVASLLTLPALRLRGLDLALVTLLTAGGFDVAFNAAGFPNGGSGFFGYAAAGDLRQMPRPGFAVGDAAYFRMVLAVVAVAYVATLLLARGRLGRAWALMACGDAPARSAGVRTVPHRIIAFAFAGFLTGVAGALIAAQVGQLSPITFAPVESLLLFALVVIGGAYSWKGWALAAVLYKIVPYFLSRQGVDGNLATIAFGVLLMTHLVAAPRGIVGLRLGAR